MQGPPRGRDPPRAATTLLAPHGQWYNPAPVNLGPLPTPEPSTNDAWLADLRAPDATREAAIARLREYLLRAVLVYLTRHRSDLSVFDFDELRQMAEDWAQQALIQVLANLDSFRGDSKFTTWAYRVAINLAAGELRRKHWENVSLDTLTEADSPDLSLKEDTSVPSPEAQIARDQVWETISGIIDDALTLRQRTVLTQIVVDGVPVEVVADRLSTNRNNIYKIVHDARRKLRREIEARNWTAEEMLAVFDGPSDP
jgi:RNA polymerase sigma-70 factor, ECF subfamily